MGRDVSAPPPRDPRRGVTQFWLAVTFGCLLVAGGGRAARGFTALARDGLHPFAPTCATPRGAHAALEKGSADDTCATQLGNSDLSRAILRAIAVDPDAHDASRALALRVLRARAGDSLAPDTDLGSARAAALRRREALARVDALARSVLGALDTSPSLRREVLEDAGGPALAESARRLALHGLYDHAALLLEGDSADPVPAWRAREARARVDPDHAPTPRSIDPAFPIETSRPSAAVMPPPSDPGASRWVVEAELGADTEAADHAASVYQAIVASLRAHPAPERAAWIRTIALHPTVETTETGSIEAVLMGRPGPPAVRAWLALHLSEASAVSSTAAVAGDGGTFWVRVGAETTLLTSGASPKRGIVAPRDALPLQAAEQADVLALLPVLDHELTRCIDATGRDRGHTATTTHGATHASDTDTRREPHPPAAHDATATGRLLADLSTRWPDAPGLARRARQALDARCVILGPWPRQGESP